MRGDGAKTEGASCFLPLTKRGKTGQQPAWIDGAREEKARNGREGVSFMKQLKITCTQIIDI